MSLGERERRFDSVEARGVSWEGAKEKISRARAVQFAIELCSEL